MPTSITKATLTHLSVWRTVERPGFPVHTWLLIESNNREETDREFIVLCVNSEARARMELTPIKKASELWKHMDACGFRYVGQFDIKTGMPGGAK